MKWAVYIDDPRENCFECYFFKTKEEAMDRVNHLIHKCEQESCDREKNLHWDIALFEVKGECVWGPDGLVLEPK